MQLEGMEQYHSNRVFTMNVTNQRWTQVSSPVFHMVPQACQDRYLSADSGLSPECLTCGSKTKKKKKEKENNTQDAVRYPLTKMRMTHIKKLTTIYCSRNVIERKILSNPDWTTVSFIQWEKKPEIP